MTARRKQAAPVALLLVTCVFTAGAAAQKKNELRYDVGPGASVLVVNPFGQVTVRPAAGRQVVVTTTTGSDQVEVEGVQHGNRIEVRSRFQQERPDPGQARAEYDVQVPADAHVTVRAGNGPLRAEGLRGNVMLEADDGRVEARNLQRAHLHIRTVSGPVVLQNVTQGHVEIVSVGGDVSLENVTGDRVSVNTTKGSIQFEGDFGKGGEYTLTNHSGQIEVSLPSSAAVEMSARSVQGSVQNDYKPAGATARSTLLETSKPTVTLRSFSGTIRVKQH